jgi:FkbM family methyltransferase
MNEQLVHTAREAEEAVIQSAQKGLFLDCGSNLGQGYTFFRNYFQPSFFDYELFEPNPNCLQYIIGKYQQIEPYSVRVHPVALATEQGTCEFYGLSAKHGGAFSEGGSTLSNHNSLYHNYEEEPSIEVQTIDFPSYVQKLISCGKVIVIKMDVEGAEYKILERMLALRLFDSIAAIFCEFHSQYMIPSEQAFYKRLEDQLIERVSRTKCLFIRWV